MNTTHPSRNPAADEQAALWAARLDGSVLGAEDRAELDAWLAEHATHRTLLSHYCQFSADLEQQLPALVASGAISLPAEKRAPRRTWNLAWIAGTALAAAAVLALAFVLFRPTPVQTFTTPFGHRETITLRDGTRVELNARSSLIVENDRRERRVRLAEGEAFFAVAKDKAHPFIVETPGGSVRVTGTRFSVRSGTVADLDVAVEEGSVEVRASDVGGARPVAPQHLLAGDRLLANAAGVERQKLSPADLEDALAWRQGNIVFHGTPLREALERFAHYHGRSITLSPAAAAADKHVGGIYGIDDLDGFLTNLATTQQLKVTRDSAGNYVVRLASE